MLVGGILLACKDSTSPHVDEEQTHWSVCPASNALGLLHLSDALWDPLAMAPLGTE